jgi:hypothetical protein
MEMTTPLGVPDVPEVNMIVLMEDESSSSETNDSGVGIAGRGNMEEERGLGKREGEEKGEERGEEMTSFHSRTGIVPMKA